MADQPVTVFNQDNQPVTTPVDAPAPESIVDASSPNTTDYADLLKGIVREDGTQKYANVPDVFKAMEASQAHIKTLEAEAIKTKSDLQERLTAEEVLAKVQANQNIQEVTPSEGLDVGQIQDYVQGIVNNTLQAVDQDKTASSNIKSVIDAMTTKFGSQEKAEEHYVKSAEAAGMTLEALNALSETSPQAVLKLAGVDGQVAVQPSLSTGSINTAALQPEQQLESLKIPVGATTKDIVKVWKAAENQI